VLAGESLGLGHTPASFGDELAPVVVDLDNRPQRSVERRRRTQVVDAIANLGCTVPEAKLPLVFDARKPIGVHPS
jgi:hypothetical protein